MHGDPMQNWAELIDFKQFCPVLVAALHMGNAHKSRIRKFIKHNSILQFCG